MSNEERVMPVDMSYQRPDKEALTLDDVEEFIRWARTVGVPGEAKLKVRLKGFTGCMSSIQTVPPTPPRRGQ